MSSADSKYSRSATSRLRRNREVTLGIDAQQLHFRSAESSPNRCPVLPFILQYAFFSWSLPNTLAGYSHLRQTDPGAFYAFEGEVSTDTRDRKFALH